MLAIAQPRHHLMFARRRPVAPAPAAPASAPPPPAPPPPAAPPLWPGGQARAGRRQSRRSGVRVVLASALAFVLIVLVVNAVTYLGSVLRPDDSIDVTAGAVPASTEPVDGRADRPPSPSLYIVQPGDTLWSIAGSIAPETDRRATVDRLAQRNGGAVIQAGQRLVLE